VERGREGGRERKIELQREGGREGGRAFHPTHIFHLLNEQEQEEEEDDLDVEGDDTDLRLARLENLMERRPVMVRN